jgi:hypothetical protein
MQELKDVMLEPNPNIVFGDLSRRQEDWASVKVGDSR